ncbi:putative Zinc finger protein [Blattamonas nauphoetae]|uniref:Zinc finger protein n=1 Tax=Blattamonas nauphoetae TaxID=2049346 RepID=A0ABQ9X249_9EUKA|nr:putative Zinc finger protein [Blattamonas nauphoetae]
MAFQSKPRGLTCYICGREFGSSSLQFHIAECEKKWDLEQEVLPKKYRIKAPNGPNVAMPNSLANVKAVTAWNEACWEIAQNARTPCPWCGRKFSAEACANHLKSCPKRQEESSGGYPGMKPRLLICYICGREYGSKSLEIHQKQCKERFLREQAQLPPGQRKPLPQPPKELPLGKTGKMSQSEIAAQNDAAYESYKDNLAECPNCGRKFNPDRLPIHLKSCKPGKVLTPLKGKTGSGTPANSDDSSSYPPSSPVGASPRGSTAPKQKAATKAPGGRPRTLVCYICGREFGTSSLEIHQKQCKEKFLREQERLPPGERKPLPEPPKSLPGPGAGGKLTQAQIDAQNDAAYETYKDNLAQCPNCGRKFNPDRLPIHLKSCKPGKVLTPLKPAASKSPQPEPEDEYDDEPPPRTSPAPTKPKGKAKSKAVSRAGPPFGGGGGGDAGAFDSIPIGGGGGGGGEISEYAEPLDLVACSRCGRKFNSDRIDKHEKICKGPVPSVQPRSSEPEPKPKPRGKPKPKEKSKWQLQHEEFQAALKAGRQVAKYQAEGRLNELPPPPPSLNPDYKQCRYCGRRFNQEAFERHEPRCATQINRPAPPPGLRSKPKATAVSKPSASAPKSKPKARR